MFDSHQGTAIAPDVLMPSDPMRPDHENQNHAEIMKRKRAFGVPGLTVPRRITTDAL
jgi:hypothetical protein